MMLKQIRQHYKFSTSLQKYIFPFCMFTWISVFAVQAPGSCIHLNKKGYLVPTLDQKKKGQTTVLNKSSPGWAVTLPTNTWEILWCVALVFCTQIQLNLAKLQIILVVSCTKQQKVPLHIQKPPPWNKRFLVALDKSVQQLTCNVKEISIIPKSTHITQYFVFDKKTNVQVVVGLGSGVYLDAGRWSCAEPDTGRWDTPWAEEWPSGSESQWAASSPPVLPQYCHGTAHT